MLTTATPLLLKLRAGVAVGALAIALSACGGTKWGFPYKTDMQQGNWITSEQVARLEKGMTREQVRFVLGTPVLQDIFRSNRWDYTYYNKPGYGKAEERKFTVWFNGDVLDHWEGDQQPDRQPFQKTDSGAGAKTPANSGDTGNAGQETAAPSATGNSGNNAGANAGTTGNDAGGGTASGTAAETRGIPSMGPDSGNASSGSATHQTSPADNGTGLRINAPGTGTLTLPNDSTPQPLR